MGIKRHKPEEIVTKLRQVEVLVGQGMARIDAIREICVVEQTVPIRLSPTPTICRVWRRVAREADEAGMDVPQREDLSFPRSLPRVFRIPCHGVSLDVQDIV